MSSVEQTSSVQPDWVTRLAHSRIGIIVLSALESTVLPVPLEAILIPVMVARPTRALQIGLAALIGCVLGGLVFYSLGALLADPVVKPALEWFGATQDFIDITDRLQDGSLFLAVFVIAISPAPMQLATLGAGVVGASPLIFVAALIASRGIRYLGLSLLAKTFGPRLNGMSLPPWAVAVSIVVFIALGVLIF
ncbi:YqaA family protein [Meridianimarinicoccus aquatilis]|uniref:DedA family protein n=1 Tax=Meridianimarinicoccus aquatilis TaxID=2552766 RepID=A0A4R6B573_9RHOB|nr:hypothetical protein [Fluviibacterium aquatile]TDL90836.1 hypothetical protein E2L05_03490 [Fluviibacterium aquatile]